MMYRWTRLSSQKWEDAWTERLKFIGPERLVMSVWPGSRALKIDVYCDKSTATRLVERFGGKATLVDERLICGQATDERPPIPIRGRLTVYCNEKEFRESTKPGAMWVPAGMAFGTGDHATTATCLRILTDISKGFSGKWRALDAGTGSGILAIAAEKLGADTVEAFDFDPACVRIAKENSKANACRRLRVSRADARDVRGFAPADVILANLFSELLVSAAPGFAGRLLPGGWLIFSGVLKTQMSGVAAGLVQAGFDQPEVFTRGKWCAGKTSLARKTSKKR